MLNRCTVFRLLCLACEAATDLRVDAVTIHFPLAASNTDHSHYAHSDPPAACPGSVAPTGFPSSTASHALIQILQVYFALTLLSIFPNRCASRVVWGGVTAITDEVDLQGSWPHPLFLCNAIKLAGALLLLFCITVQVIQ